MKLRFMLLAMLAMGCSERMAAAGDDAKDADLDDGRMNTSSCDMDTAFEPDSLACEAGLGETCSSSCPCATGLECMDGFCGSCPAGNPGCACEAGGACDIGLACINGYCVDYDAG